MSEPVVRVPGKLIKDFCEAFGVVAEDVYLIEIQPTSVVILHRFRNEGGPVLLNGDRSDVLRQRTEIRIDWTEAGR